ncbi:MAG: GTP 3',8-cyclase MoaA [Flavisolibacter sp.]
MLLDQFQRVHDYLRISLTDSCNLRCTYCMPDEKISCMPFAQLMQPDEIDMLVEIFVNLGVKKIRFTGGEPLVRKDAGKIISMISKYPVELTVTTNGTRLHEFLEEIINSRIRSLNISLDTLQPEKFLQLTRRNAFNLVWNNIHLMIKAGLHVKVNVVVMKGVNDHEIPDFIEWTKNIPVHIRFIEVMPFTGNVWDSKQVFGWKEILSMIEKQYEFTPLQNKKHDTAKNYSVKNHAGTFAVISTMTQPFCSDCNRMRLTADGKMKNCLFSKNETDLLSALRKGDDVEKLIRECIGNKAAERGGQFSNGFDNIDPLKIENRSMIAIGG